MAYSYRWNGNRTPVSKLQNRSSWGPMSTPTTTTAPTSAQTPVTPEDYAELYQEHVLSTQSRQLYPLQEDLADWINKTIGTDSITGENFFDVLDNGVIVCHLAKVIQDKAKHTICHGLAKGPAPTISGRCWETAARRSFFARDNMENFIQFCRKLGVHENLLFESDDLVLQGQPRNVVLCLLEVARLATKYNIEPPGLVQLEKEIAEQESQDSGFSHSSLLSWQFRASPSIATSDSKIRHSSSSSAISGSSINRWGDSGVMLLTTNHPVQRPTTLVAASGASDGVPSDTTEDDWSRGSGEDPDLEIDTHTVDLNHANSPSPGPGGDAPAHIGIVTELDRRVQHATRLMQKHCNCSDGKCSKLKVKKVGEGRYNIAGRNVFVRLLKGRHMMVRVGGGWDTLEHFLVRHDPCQVKAITPIDRPSSAAAKFLPLHGKQCGSPPAREREPVTR